MSDSQGEEVRGLALFATMGDVNFKALMRGTYVQNFPPRIDLIHENEPADFLHVVLSGAVDLFSQWNRRETSMATVRPVSTFILAASISDLPYLMSARTLEKSRIALIPSQDVRRMFAADTAFATAIAAELANSYRTVVKNTKDLKLRTSLERLANYLLRQSRTRGAPDFDLTTEKKRLASFLGMTPENLSRAFRALEPHGVKVEGSHITITDPQGLARYAKPNPLIDDYST
ncbi:helix-turn-helix domain-containing protein [Oceaniglobus indicus]|uniref:helix-turn-helix domain-containing protein n=1 Tax=Oceaniglobus indicus TaxID=2047749 RepID=UPI000C175BF5|nr:helix-turn-helix domain-containing protein [Oceaniglobus indicus]